MGEILTVGPGKEDDAMKLAPGDKVVYFKYAGDKMIVCHPPEPNPLSEAGDLSVVMLLAPPRLTAP